MRILFLVEEEEEDEEDVAMENLDVSKPLRGGRRRANVLICHFTIVWLFFSFVQCYSE